MFKWNRDRVKAFWESLDNQLNHSTFSWDLLEWANALGLRKPFDSTSNPNYKTRFGFSLVFYRYYEEIQTEWWDFLCTVWNGFF